MEIAGDSASAGDGRVASVAFTGPVSSNRAMSPMNDELSVYTSGTTTRSTKYSGPSPRTTLPTRTPIVSGSLIVPSEKSVTQ